MKRFSKIILIFILLFLFFGSELLGEEISLTARVNKNRLRLGEEFKFNIEISGEYRTTPKIEFPDLKDFEILSKKSSYNFNIKEGKFLSQTRFTFILEPRAEGKFIIGEVKVRYRRKEYKTEPIEIMVLPGIKKGLPKEPKKKYPPMPKVTL